MNATRKSLMPAFLFRFFFFVGAAADAMAAVDAPGVGMGPDSGTGEPPAGCHCAPSQRQLPSGDREDCQTDPSQK
jgi:hypothetical protein